MPHYIGKKALPMIDNHYVDKYASTVEGLTLTLKMYRIHVIPIAIHNAGCIHDKIIQQNCCRYCQTHQDPQFYMQKVTDRVNILKALLGAATESTQ